MNKQILALTLLALGALHFGTQNKAVVDSNIEAKFNAWKLQYNVEYDTVEEHNYRLAAFAETEKFIIENTNEQVQHAHNQFSHFTKEEFSALYLGWNKPERKATPQSNDMCTEIGPLLCGGSDCESCLNEYTSLGLLDCTAADISAVCGSGPVPPVNITNVDWRTSGQVQVVKDQGQCGSCWAFSTVAATESAATIIGGGELGDYSEQQLVDCSGSYGNQGCNGGLMDDGFQYIIDHGICAEDAYPYTARDGSCKASSCTSVGTVSSFTDVASGSVSGLSSALEQQVVAVAVDAQSGWQTYSGGILSNCGTSLDHGVTLVGQNQGDESSGSYLIVKNSWGSSWGEEGYIRLAYGNTCGIANSASTPTP